MSTSQSESAFRCKVKEHGDYYPLPHTLPFTDQSNGSLCSIHHTDSDTSQAIL